MKPRLVWITPDAERMIGYCARASNPDNQGNDAARLLRYCIRHKHWSPFEMASMCIEIKTSRIIADQILRHSSFSFQVFSTRYAEVQDFVPTSPRRQAKTNRQSSIDDLPESTREWFIAKQHALWADAKNAYDTATNLGIARENARDLLPLSVESTMYMSGTVRSWIHYLNVRTAEETQVEHRVVAYGIRDIFNLNLPTIAGAIWADEVERGLS